MKKTIKKRKAAPKRSGAKKKMPKYQIQGIKIYNMLEKLSRPSRIKDAVKWLHANR